MTSRVDYTSNTYREHPSVRTIHIAGAATQVDETYGSFTRLDKSGAKNPNYLLDLATGNLPKSLPLSYEREEVRTWSGSMSFIDRYRFWYHPYDWYVATDMSVVGDTSGFFNDPFRYPPQSTPFMRSQAEEEAKQKCLEKIKDQKVNMGQVLAEAGQTASLIQTTAFRLADFIALLRQKKLRQACRVIGVSPSRGLRKRFGRAWEDSPSHAVGNAFIELHFGWKPLIQDVQGYAEQIAALSEDTYTEIIKKRARSTRSTTDTRISDERRGTIVSIESVSFEVSVGCTFKAADAIDHVTASLGLQNPLALLEELTPFSFVLDWFVGIGDVLSNLDATFGLIFLDGWMKTTELISQHVTFVAHHEPDQPENHLRSGASSRSYNLVRVVRQPLSDFPTSYIPVIHNPFNLKHIGLSLALIRQRI